MSSTTSCETAPPRRPRHSSGARKHAFAFLQLNQPPIRSEGHPFDFCGAIEGFRAVSFYLTAFAPQTTFLPIVVRGDVVSANSPGSTLQDSLRERGEVRENTRFEASLVFLGKLGVGRGKRS
jgi:hypothetical protein